MSQSSKPTRRHFLRSAVMTASGLILLNGCAKAPSDRTASEPVTDSRALSDRDTQWAAWIQKAVERYSLHTPLVKETGLPKRLGKVFRDREELATGQNLGNKCALRL